MDRTLKQFDDLAALTQGSLAPEPAPSPASVTPAAVPPGGNSVAIQPGPSIFSKPAGSTRASTQTQLSTRTNSHPPSKTPSELIALLLRERAMSGRLQRSSNTRVVKPEGPVHFQPDAIPEVQIAPKHENMYSRSSVYKVIK